MTTHLADYRPSFHLRFGALASAFASVWFRYRIDGLETIPARPCFFVGNHSGIGIADVICMMGAWSTQFEGRRRVVGMMHDLFVRAPVIGPIARAYGAVRADPRAAREALAHGYDLAAFPGGNVDSCRSFTAPREVRFGKHRGYVKLALETGVPVVPIATVGSHWSYLVLPFGEEIGRLIGLRRFSRDSVATITVGALLVVLAAVLAVAGVVSGWWIAAALVAAIVPTPVRVTSRVLPAIDVRAATAHIDDPAERIEAAHRLVHGALAAAVATLK